MQPTKRLHLFCPTKLFNYIKSSTNKSFRFFIQTVDAKPLEYDYVTLNLRGNPRHHSFYTLNALIEYSVRVNIRYGIIRNQPSNYNTISLFHSPLLLWYFSYFRHEIFRRNVIRAITLCGTAPVEDCSLNVSRLKTNPQPS